MFAVISTLAKECNFARKIAVIPINSYYYHIRSYPNWRWCTRLDGESGGWSEPNLPNIKRWGNIIYILFALATHTAQRDVWPLATVVGVVGGAIVAVMPLKPAMMAHSTNLEHTSGVHLSNAPIDLATLRRRHDWLRRRWWYHWPCQLMPTFALDRARCALGGPI